MTKAPGFLVKSPCGRHYFVPLEAVRQDYAACIRQMDGLNRKASLAYVDEQGPDALVRWFAEQWNWDDVADAGAVVRDASARDVKRALDHMRESTDDNVYEHAKLVKRCSRRKPSA